MHIDHGYNVAAAKLAKAANVPHYSLCSAANANVRSYFTYPYCKGLIEKDLTELNFDSLSIFRPGVLDRGEMARWNEKLIPFGAIPVSVVAHAMRIQAGSVLPPCLKNRTRSERTSRTEEGLHVLKLRDA